MRFFVCLFALVAFLYLSIDQQNDLTALRMEIPRLAKEVKLIQEENTRLKYEIDRFENPTNLMALAQQNNYRHLKHPLVETVCSLKEGIALSLPDSKGKVVPYHVPVLVGASR